eukprot:CAMPEP_0180324190 /NCGR_PEP_ID=MMETSP0988-20121125/37721_1 /TAXON_ID=697907 /ORGANISM="non described non described, Strain CCMP2293" /LENGTH=101 /DNA_ID=CAMNT_0022310461 /DNA_START=319 /DNA_END=621 /DNA_ORIENTATION=+
MAPSGGIGRRPPKNPPVRALPSPGGLPVTLGDLSHTPLSGAAVLEGVGASEPLSQTSGFASRMPIEPPSDEAADSIESLRNDLRVRASGPARSHAPHPSSG